MGTESLIRSSRSLLRIEDAVRVDFPLEAGSEPSTRRASVLPRVDLRMKRMGGESRP